MPIETDPAAIERIHETSRIGYLCGQWVSHEYMLVSVDDAGFRQGVTAVERLRTHRGRPFEVDAHLSRWNHTLDVLSINANVSSIDLIQLIDELLDRNQEWIAKVGDVGITLFATPGIARSKTSTFGLHLNPLDHAANQLRRRDGQVIVVTDVRQPSADAWPRSVKVRCRLHYYRADLAARSLDVDAVGVLLDDDGSITETSVSNIAIVEAGVIVSPPGARILGGITQSVVERTAAESSIGWRKEPITPSRLRAADEVLLMGTDTGLWFANRIDHTAINEGRPGPTYSVLAAHPIWAE